MSDSTENMIRELAAGLPPVKPLGRLRDAILLALLISLPFDAYWLLSSGLREQFRLGESPDVTFLAVAAILVTLLIGGSLAGLAAAIPGREDAFALGRNLTIGGAVAGGLLFAISWVGSGTEIGEVMGSSLQCIIGATTLGVPTSLYLASYVLRGAPVRAPVAIALACAGGIGVSASIVHLTCSHRLAAHLVLGHGLAPIAVGAAVLLSASLVYALGSALRPQS